MPEFNLVDQPWIPCLILETGAARELSLLVSNFFNRSSKRLSRAISASIASLV